jgi:hypothetical protein
MGTNNQSDNYQWIIYGFLIVVIIIIVVLFKMYLSKKKTVENFTELGNNETENFNQEEIQPPNQEEINDTIAEVLQKMNKELLKDGKENFTTFTNISGLESFFDLDTKNSFQNTPNTSVDLRTKLKRHKALLTFIQKKMLAAQENNEDEEYERLKENASPIIENINSILAILNDPNNNYNLDDVVDTPDSTPNTTSASTEQEVPTTTKAPITTQSQRIENSDVLREDDPSGVFIHSVEQEGIDSIFVPRMSFL